MRPRRGRRATPALASLSSAAVALAAGPGVAAAQPVDPGTVADASAVVRGLGSFVLVGLVGAVILARRDGVVHRAVDDAMDRPAVAVIYGMVSFVLVLFAATYANNLLAHAGLAATPVGYVAFVVLAGGLACLAGLGYLVVGTLLTDVRGVRSPRRGLVVGAALSSVGWLLLPAATALAVWVIVAAFGVGGLTRTWVHSERVLTADLDS